MPDGQPEDIVLHLLRDIRERMEVMATKGDLAKLPSEVNSLRADVAADLHDLDAKIDTTHKDLSDQMVGLRRAVVEYHSTVIGHGTIIADLEARVRRVEQRLGLDL